MNNRTSRSRPVDPPARKAASSKPAADSGSGRAPAIPERANDSVIKLIRRIRAGTLRGRMLAPADRQRCVEHLTWEGVSAPEIAEILGLSERTVNRDRAQIRSHNALMRDPALAGELAGLVVQQGERAIASLRRIGKDSATPPAVRVETERIAFELRRQTIQTLQSLGYLPTAATEFRGQIAGEMGLHVPQFAELGAQVQNLVQAAKRRGITDPEVLAELKQLGAASTAFSIQQRALDLEARLDQRKGA